MASSPSKLQAILTDTQWHFVDKSYLEGATNPILGTGKELVLTSVTNRVFVNLALPIIRDIKVRSWSSLSNTDQEQLTEIFKQIGLSDRLQQFQAAVPDEYGRCTYTGKLDKIVPPNEKGTTQWSNGSSYDGERKDGKFHGRGIFKVGGDRNVEISGIWNEDQCEQSDCLNCNQPVTGSLEKIQIGLDRLKLCNIHLLAEHAAYCGVIGAPAVNEIYPRGGFLEPTVRIVRELKLDDGKELTVDGEVVVLGANSIGFDCEYEGMLRKSNKQPHGWGIIQWNNGSRYVGESRNGRFQGIGMFLDNSKRISFIGFWMDSQAQACICSCCNEPVSGGPYSLRKHAKECQTSRPQPAI